MPGTLYIVATPIGNLEDISHRALRILREVALIAAEDTRRTKGLLTHFAIHTPTVSFHAHNEQERAPRLLEKLRAGESIAVVTDAGTPLISDPGAALVRTAREIGIRVEAIPGASALLAALVTAGLPTETFAFLGFAPHRAGARRTWLGALAAEPRTTVFFEAPHRLASTLEAIAQLLPDRRLAVARELTKVHEEVLTGTASAVLSRLGQARGEFTVVVAPPLPEAEATTTEVTDDVLWREFCSLTAQSGVTRRGAVATLARRYARPAREIYAALERRKLDSSSEG